MTTRTGIHVAMGLLISGAGAPLAAQATPSATQSISFRVEGAAGPLDIQRTDANRPPEPAVDSTTTYAITTNDSTATITMPLDEEMPRGLTLSEELTALSRALVAERTALSGSERSVMMGEVVTGGGLRINYELSGDASVESRSATRMMTFTIVAGP